MKKILALVLALMMVMGLATSAFAADTTYTLTIENTLDGHTYEAYQIFSGDLVHQDGKDVLSNIEWGSGITDGDALLAAIKEEAKLNVLHGATTAAELAKLLGTVSSDSETLDLFASIVGKHLKTDAAKPSKFSTDKYTITGLEAGYYLVKDKDNSLPSTHHVSYTKFILRVIKDQTVSPKSDVPEVEKEINDTLNDTYHKYDDFDIADIAYYKWTGTLPSNLSAYDVYYYKFMDNLPTGIVFEAIQQIYIEGHDGNVVHTFYDITDADTENNTLPAGITIAAQGQSVTRQADGSFAHSGTAYSDKLSGKVSVEFTDLFTSYPNILNTHKIVVKYTALVSRDATFTVMTNDVRVEYSNNPNDPTGNGHGTTIPDEAYAFTFQIKVDKHDADDITKKLENAKFVLYYQRIQKIEGVDTTVKYYAQVVTEEMIAAGTEINGVAVTDKYLGNVYGWTTDESQASILDTDADGYMRVGGLDADTYFLKETEAPAGYNKMETPVQIDIIPTYTNGGKDVSIEYKVDYKSQGASDVVMIRNSAGSTLPVTGGIGTTVFYVLGTIMVLGATVLLITKRRMSV